ncbi:TetR/AcrR family transcriptional regulator [Mycolicibacterium litorale]|uniref:TetR/AcrR family transcriptional regulator n=1 Tax=Mycolicibacterium litorale TaxID=758802 RepID=UPI003CE9D698
MLRTIRNPFPQKDDTESVSGKQPLAVRAVVRPELRTMRMDSDANGAASSRVRKKRVDAQRNVDALLEAAKTVFARSGVDAPAKEITDEAGVGVGTLYRHFPRRADLVAAVLAREIDACAAIAPELSAAHAPWEALARWLVRFTEFVGTKRGLAGALNSADPSFETLFGYFLQRLEPVVTTLIDAAVTTGDLRSDVNAKDLMYAVALLCQPVPDENFGYNQRLVGVFLDGLNAAEER